ncbi:facilitated trehalose transporter Tret1-2 homolog [Epargyreus clarus]|uniref:facilitated trehalose transporter Tret1-2 homolog n=1 Tax=Epargyreus clarus TaxID=520877 RepID=UPI003C2AC108
MSVLFLIGVCSLSFTWGIIIAFPSVLNPAILAPDATIKATPDQASWIAAAHGIAGLVGFTVMSPVFEFFGRKMANIVVNLFCVVGCLIYYVADDVHSLLFARLTQGLSSGGLFISIMALSECSAPKRRGYFMVLNKAALGVGSLACHSLGFFLDWRQIIVFVNLIPASISIIIFIICAESPSYYAMREQFDKCTTAFKWYRGDSQEANKELKELIAAQAKNIEEKRKETTLATISLDSCGRYFILAYMTQIIVEITNSTSVGMYISVAADCILISALLISCFTVKIFKRRTLLFNLGFCSVVLMYLVSLSILLCRHPIMTKGCRVIFIWNSVHNLLYFGHEADSNDD